ncbi:MAG: type II toxin-antitoxin system RelE/ParE family toxin [Roseiarcus sp.]
MRAYLTRSFDRDAKRDGISDENCQEAIRKAERGLIDAELGGGLIKQRIPRGNQGAARGSRAIVFYRRAEVAVFLHIFPKSRKANLTKSELAEYLKAAQVLEKLSEKEFLASQATKGWRLLEI